jgi:hypothetical protein
MQETPPRDQRASAPSRLLITTVDANGLVGSVQAGEGEEAHAPEATTRAPLPRLGIRETWAQFRRSSAFHDLLAECALWWASCTCLPLYHDPDCAEEFAQRAAVWRNLPFDENPDAASPRTDV